MARTVTLDGNVITVDTEILEHFREDEELSTTEIVIKESTQLEPYDMGLQCTVLESAITQYYITGADNVALTGRSPNTYTHTITLIEPYKLLERMTMPSLTYIQPLDTTKYTLLDVVDRALKLYKLEETSNLGGNRIYDIQGVGTRDANDDYIVGNLTGLAEALYNVKAPNFEFNTPTLRELLDEVFLLLNGRATITGFTTIDILYFNDKVSEISLNDVDEISGRQNIGKNAQNFDIYMENAVSEANVNKQARVYPSTLSWGSVRSNEVELTTSNFLMEVNEKIERVLKFEVYADVDINAAAGTGYSGVIEVDMTDFVFFKRAWDSLDYNYTNVDTLSYNVDTFWKAPYKNNSLYIDNKQLKGFHENIDIFTGVFSNVKQWHLFLVTAAWQGGYLNTLLQPDLSSLGKPSFNTNVRDFMFRLTYVPKETVRLRIERDKNVGVGDLFYNQNARVIDAELLGANAQTRINKEGNKELTFTKKVDNFTQGFSIGDYYQDYTVYKVDNQRLGQYMLSVATLSKNFAKRSERIDLANKPRQTAISEDNTIRNDVINQYIVAQTTTEAHDTYFTSLGRQRFLDTFRDSPIQTNDVQLALWNDTLITEVTSQGLGTVLTFKLGFDNPIAAGSQTDLLDTIYGNRFIQYANDDATLTTLKLKYYGGLEADTPSFANYALIGQKLPEYDATLMDLQEGYITIPELNYLKDSGEISAFTYQATIKSNDDDIFIGNKLATENSLVVAQTNDLYLFKDGDPIPFEQRLDLSQFPSSQKLVTGTPVDSSEVKIATAGSALGDSITFSTNFLNPTNWAVADIDGNVYFICNKQVDKIYFIYKKEVN